MGFFHQIEGIQQANMKLLAGIRQQQRLKRVSRQVSPKAATPPPTISRVPYQERNRPKGEDRELLFLRARVQELESTVHQERISRASERLSSLVDTTARVKSVQEANCSHQPQVERLEEENHTLKEDLARKSRLITGLREEKKERQTRLDNLQDEMRGLSEREAKVVRDVQRKDALLKEMRAKQEQLRGLEDQHRQIALLVNELQQRDNMLQEARTQQARLRQEIQRHMASVCESRARQTTQQEEITDLLKREEGSQRQIAVLEHRLATALATENSIASEKTDLQRRVDKLESAVDTVAHSVGRFYDTMSAVAARSNPAAEQVHAVVSSHFGLTPRDSQHFTSTERDPTGSAEEVMKRVSQMWNREKRPEQLVAYSQKLLDRALEKISS